MSAKVEPLIVELFATLMAEERKVVTVADGPIQTRPDSLRTPGSSCNDFGTRTGRLMEKEMEGSSGVKDLTKADTPGQEDSGLKVGKIK